MLTTYSRIISRLAFLVSGGAIGFLSLLPVSSLPETGVWDKLEHLAAYGWLVVPGLWAFPQKQNVPRLVAGVIFYGIMLEVLQSLVPGRHPSFTDIIANSLGVALGCAVAYIYRQTRLRIRA